MSGQSSSSYGDTDPGTDRAPSTTASSRIRWAPHGPAMTACLVAVNLALIALVYLYFWRLFSRKRAASSASALAASGPDNDDDDDETSSSASTPSSPARAGQDQQREHDRLVASLPTFVVARSGAGAGECAVCIAELRDGDEARALPRCGHRFHAACVDASLRRRHTTCPLCRASVVAAEEAEGAGPKGGGVTDTTTSAAADTDSPV